MTRQPPLLCAALLALSAVPVAAQEAPQFRADVTQTGDTPFTGTMYFGGPRMRIEGTSDGEPITMIIDRTAGRMLMLMPEDRMYMVMDLGSMPFSAPGADTMDPANPCSSGEVTQCENLGTESVNGRATRKWAYVRDGERETVWIAADLRFPVRIEDADGSTTDFTNVAMGPQPAALFEPPAGYTAMDMGGVLGGRGRGATGRGSVPPGAARGAVPPGAIPPGAIPPGGLPAGVDPAMLAQLGLDPATIAQMMQQGAAAATPTNSGPWEQGDGWVVDYAGTASGSGNQTNETGSRFSETYSVRFTGSVPIPYGTPAVGAAVGPAWQLVPTLGSARGLEQPLTYSWTSEYHSELTNPAECPNEDAVRVVRDSRGSGELSTTDHNSVEMMSTQARFEISGDLRTFDLMVGAASAGNEATTTTTINQGTCPGSQTSTLTENDARDIGIGGMVTLTGQPLPASPGQIRGTATVPMRFEIGAFSGELPATVEWTLRPIG